MCYESLAIQEKSISLSKFRRYQDFVKMKKFFKGLILLLIWGSWEIEIEESTKDSKVN